MKTPEISRGCEVGVTGPWVVWHPERQEEVLWMLGFEEFLKLWLNLKSES
jgi:hypothetical protein